MSDKSVILIVVVILFLFLIYTTLKSRKAAKYDVTVGDVIYKGLVRNRWDSLDDTRDEMCFHKADGKKIWLSKHFTITREEVEEVKEAKK
jgi:hypothetical protein